MKQSSDSQTTSGGRRLPIASILIAGVAFGMGWALKPVPDAPITASVSAGDDNSSRDGTTGLKSEPSKFLISAKDRMAHKQKDEFGNDPSGLRVGMGQPLSSRQISQLGEQFKVELDPIKRRKMFLEMLDGMTVENAKEIREQIKHLNERSSEFRDFHYAWGQIGGVDAVMHGMDTPKPDMEATISGWASADPVAAMEWFAALPQKRQEGQEKNFNNQDHLRMGLVHGLANNDPSLAAEFVYQRAKDGDKMAGRMLHEVAGKVMAAQGPAGAARWVDALPAGDLRGAAISRVARDFAYSDPKSAAMWAASHNNQPGGDRAIGEVSSAWSRKDPEGAINWLTSLEPGSARNNGFGSAFSNWSRKDLNGAGNYINQMAASPERDRAVAGLSNTMIHKDPGATLEWARSIQDQGVREGTIRRATETLYHRRNHDMAREFLSQSGVAPETQQKWFESFQKRGRR